MKKLILFPIILLLFSSVSLGFDSDYITATLNQIGSWTSTDLSNLHDGNNATRGGSLDNDMDDGEGWEYVFPKNFSFERLVFVNYNDGTGNPTTHDFQIFIGSGSNFTLVYSNSFNDTEFTIAVDILPIEGDTVRMLFFNFSDPARTYFWVGEIQAFGSNITPPGVGNESTESLAVSKQIGSVSFTSASALVNDVSFNLSLDNISGYYSHIMEIERQTGAGAGTIFCEAELNGVQIANLTQGFTNSPDIQNVYLISQNITYTNGFNNATITCSRLTGGGQYNIRKTVSIGHVMINENDELIQNEFFVFNLSGLPANFTILDSFNFTTSNFTSDPDINVTIILDWTAQFDYTSTGNMSVMLQVNGTNCSTYQIERVSGDTATVGGTCAYREDILPDTDYLVNIFGQDSGGIVFMNIFAKEIRLDTQELTLESILGAGVRSVPFLQVNTSPITNASIIVKNIDHAQIDLSIQVGVMVRSNNGSGTIFLKTVTTGPATQNSSLYQADIDEFGAQIFLQDIIQNAPIGTFNVTIFGACTPGDCTITAADGVVYLTNIITEFSNAFNATAFSSWDNSSIDNFSVTLSGGTIFFTTTGLLPIFSPITLENLTFNSTNNGGYFPAFAFNHSTNTSINQSMNQTIINFSQLEVISGDVLSGVNFTIDGFTQDVFNLKADTYNVTAQKTDYFDITKEITVVALQNNTIILTDMFNLILNITVTNLANNTNISQFNGSVELLPLPTFTTNFMAINGFVEVGVLQNLSYTISLDIIAGLANTGNVINITATNTTNITLLPINFGLFTNNSISFSIFDLINNSLFNGLVNVTLIGTTITIEDSTSNGTLFLDELNDDTYEIFFESATTDTVRLFITVSSGSHQFVNVFLSSGNELKDFLVQDNLGVFQSGVTLTFLQNINGTPSTVGQTRTDFSGRSSIFLNENVTFQFFAQKSGFITFFGNVTPTEPEYTVIIFRDTAGIPESIFNTLTWSTPFIFTVGSTQALARFIVNSADGSLQLFGLNASYLGINYTSIDTTPQGAILNLNITNIDPSQDNLILVNYFFKLVGEDIIIWNTTYFLDVVNASDSSLTGGLFADLQALENTNAVKGLVGFTIIFLLVLIFASLGRDVTPTIIGGLIGLGINWFFTLLPRELLVISMVVLLIILVADNVGGGALRMAAPLVKVFTVLLSINIILFLGGVRVIGDDNVDFINNFINVEESVNGSVVPSSTIEESLPDSFTQGGSSLLQFIDSLGAIQNMVFFVINIVFTPLGLFTSAGIPSAITMIIGIPLMTMMFFGIIYFIRSGA